MIVSLRKNRFETNLEFFILLKEVPSKDSYGNVLPRGIFHI